MKGPMTTQTMQDIIGHEPLHWRGDRSGLELIRTLPDNARCFLVKHGQESVVVRLNLAGEDAVLTVLSGRERTVRLFDEIRARTGDDPAKWLPELVKVA